MEQDDGIELENHSKPYQMFNNRKKTDLWWRTIFNLPLKVKIEDEHTYSFPRFNAEEAKCYPDAFFEGQRTKKVWI